MIAPAVSPESLAVAAMPAPVPDGVVIGCSVDGAGAIAVFIQATTASMIRVGTIASYGVASIPGTPGKTS
jgi:hypothetical protein